MEMLNVWHLTTFWVLGHAVLTTVWGRRPARPQSESAVRVTANFELKVKVHTQRWRIEKLEGELKYTATSGAC